MSHNIFRIWILLFIFLILIAFPLLNVKNKLVKDIANTENRKMAARPYFQKGHIDEFAGKYETFFNENFSIRSYLVKAFNLFNLKVLKKSPIPDRVILGKDGWLFMGKTEDESYTGKKRLTEAELEEFKKEMDFRKKYLNERGIQFYFVIAPIKAAIYPEKIPNDKLRNHKQTWGEQVLDYLNKNSELKPIDVYSVLRENKGKELLYYKLDNHWNQVGAMYSTREILRRMKIDFPQIKIPAVSDYSITKLKETKGNISKMLANVGGFEDDYFQVSPNAGFKAVKVKTENYAVDKEYKYALEYEIEKEIKNSKEPKILIISDSFGVNVFPLISEHFRRTVKIFDGWEYKLNEEIIKLEKPDIVLVIALESNIKNILKHQSRFQKNL